jgi:protein-tyrosine phosphatase
MTVSALPINEANRLPGIQYKFVFMMDMTNQDILGDNLLEDAIAYIEQAVHDNVNILVHCEVGVSRSVTVVAAYLMRRFEWSGKKAVYFIKDKRPTAW